mgnify:CR=1 FL=1|tara:strand:+ start:299 stop:847 length:549 start_codon:yes stop_codon:yes gene_type:complete
MKQLMEKIVAGWDSLSPSDRRTLKIASPLILVLFLYLVLIQPILGYYLDVKKQRQQLQENLVWLYENAALVSRMQNVCSRERPVVRGNDSLAEFAQNIGRRAGAEVNVRVINTREMDISVASMPGGNALGLVQSYVCAGFDVADLLVVRPASDAPQVELRVSLSASGVIANQSSAGTGQGNE